MEPDKPPQVNQQPNVNPTPSLTPEQPPFSEPNQQTPINPQIPVSAPPPPQPSITKDERQPQKTKRSSWWSGLKWYEYIICGIPLVLIFIGGAIGGGVGGGAFALNVILWKSDKSELAKIASVMGVTIGAFVLYFVIAILVQSIFFADQN